MKTIIEALDFSMPSYNAVHYAARMYQGWKDVRFILYHYYDDLSEAGNSRAMLNSLKNELSEWLPDIETFAESGDNMIDSLSAYAHVKGAYMIVMGLMGKNSLAHRFSGSHSLRMAEKNVCPVLIVPAGAKFAQIKNVLIASEMKNVDETPALLAVKRILSDFKPILHILNVDSKHYVSLTSDYQEAKLKMQELLTDYNPEFYFMRLYDFHESVNLFTEDKNIDLIMIAPRYHGFFERLFKTPHTQAVVYHSKVPVLAVHE